MKLKIRILSFGLAFLSPCSVNKLQAIVTTATSAAPLTTTTTTSSAQVVKAVYGTADVNPNCLWVDVTSKVSGNVIASQSGFGIADPCPNTPKTTTIQYSNLSASVLEGATVPQNVKYAYYGAGKGIDVTDKVKGIISNKQNVTVSNDTMANGLDIAPGVAKQLKITYSDATIPMTPTPEGQAVPLTPPVIAKVAASSPAPTFSTSPTQFNLANDLASWFSNFLISMNPGKSFATPVQTFYAVRKDLNNWQAICNGANPALIYVSPQNQVLCTAYLNAIYNNCCQKVPYGGDCTTSNYAGTERNNSACRSGTCNPIGVNSKENTVYACAGIDPCGACPLPYQ